MWCFPLYGSLNGDHDIIKGVFYDNQDDGIRHATSSFSKFALRREIGIEKLIKANHELSDYLLLSTSQEFHFTQEKSFQMLLKCKSFMSTKGCGWADGWPNMFNSIHPFYFSCHARFCNLSLTHLTVRKWSISCLHKILFLRADSSILIKMLTRISALSYEMHGIINRIVVGQE